MLVRASRVRLADIASRIGAQLEGDPELDIVALEPLDQAGPGSLSFLANPRYAGLLATTRASAVIIGPEVKGPGCAVLRCGDPYRAFGSAAALFAHETAPEEGLDPSASVHPEAVLGVGVRIAARVVVGAAAVVGARTILHPGVVLYPGARVGEDCVVHANVVVRESVLIGSRVVVGAGAVLGSEGFGYLPLPGGGIARLPQIGGVSIEDEVEIGANTTIDRAAIGFTRVGRATKIDNLVMVAHGCRIEEEVLIAGQVGLAGSTQIGARTQLGGQVGSAGHLRIGNDVRVAGQSGIVGDIPDGATVAGLPAEDAVRWRRVVTALRRLPELLRRVRRLERSLEGAAGDETSQDR